MKLRLTNLNIKPQNLVNDASGVTSANCHSFKTLLVYMFYDIDNYDFTHIISSVNVKVQPFKLRKSCYKPNLPLPNKLFITLI